MLIEKIVNLQKSLAHKSEKLDFAEAHVAGLVEEMSRKNRHVHALVEFVAFSQSVCNALLLVLCRQSGYMQPPRSNQRACCTVRVRSD